MDRVGLKSKAKELFKGNKWHIWKPLVMFGLVIAIISVIALVLDQTLGLTRQATYEFFGQKMTYNAPGIISTIVGIVTGLASVAFSIAYAYYMLSFVRGTKLEMKDIVDFMKKHWVKAFVVSLLVGLIVLCGSILLVIPGIIAAIGLTFFQEVCADNPEMGAMDIIRKAWEITKGHKMDLFVLSLSFIGWSLLADISLGIGYIWLLPYMVVTFTLAYEELRK